MFFPCKPAKIALQSQQFVDREYDYNWIAEVSMQGIRCMAHHHFNRIDLWARGGRRISAPLVELRRQIKSMIPDETIIDGVLFGTGPVKSNYFVFDIPRLKRKENANLSERYYNLMALYKKQPLIRITEHCLTRGKRMFFYESFKLPEVKGIIIKDLTKTYPIGTRIKNITDRWIEVTR
jgi:ATP-dependent DNA ligase